MHFVEIPCSVIKCIYQFRVPLSSLFISSLFRYQVHLSVPCFVIMYIYKFLFVITCIYQFRYQVPLLVPCSVIKCIYQFGPYPCNLRLFITIFPIKPKFFVFPFFCQRLIFNFKSLKKTNPKFCLKLMIILTRNGKPYKFEENGNSFL